ncbi:MAG: TIR domain-containing protein [Candidatus Korarchaeota archaeon]|nr:TIR domain-containing protein [Candidatus Korarchaeota archaeon]NIW13560.1 TIR domain-containing protein [Candidatus Thorarchaeota archaeon]
MDKQTIFLCHANEDKQKVVQVYQRLKKDGFQPWLDKEDVLPGQNWREITTKIIKESTLVIIFFSKKAVSKQGFVQKEMNLASDVRSEMPEGEVFIIPVRLDDCDIPKKFSDLHYCDIFEKGGYEKLVRTIQTRIRRTLDRSDVHQAAAICYMRQNNSLKFLLVPSSSGKRWIFPKGNVKKAEDLSRAAQREAEEEAGVFGRISSEPLTTFWHIQGKGKRREYKVAAFLLEVTRIEKDKAERKAKWFTYEKALSSLEEEREPEEEESGADRAKELQRVLRVAHAAILENRF